MHNPEEQLHSERNKVRLLRTEKEAVLNRILKSAPKKNFLIASPYVHTFRHVMIPLAVILLASIPVTYAAQTSKPGDFLYEMEIGLIEPIEESFYITRLSKVSYHTARLEERLDELQAISEVPLDSEDLETVTEDVDDHIETITTSLAGSTEPEQTMRHLVKSKAIIEAQKEVLENINSDTDISSATIDTELEKVSNIYANEENPEEVEQTIAETISVIQETVSADSPQFSESFKDKIEDIDTAVQNGELEEALNLSNDMQVDTLKQQYLDDQPEEESSL